MEYERKGVTISWQIENIVHCIRNQRLYSPAICLDVLDGTKWRLGVRGISNCSTNVILKREEEDNGPKVLQIHFQFSSISSFNGTSVPSTKLKVCGRAFPKNVWFSTILWYKDKMRMVDTPDTVTIICKIWRQVGSISKSCYIFARSRIKTEHIVKVKTVKHFSDFSMDEERTLMTVSSSNGDRLMTICLFLYPLYWEEAVHAIGIKITPVDNQTERCVCFKLFVLKSSGSKTGFGRLESSFVLQTTKQFTLPFFSKEHLLQNAATFLQNDTLSLLCETIFYSGNEYEKVEKVEYEADSVPEAKQSDFSNAVDFLNCTVGIPSDTNLETATETFPANTKILSSKSPVFDAMFKTEMKEKIQKCVPIDDVDAETVKRMLVFLYADIMEEIEWKDAMKLYFAADKYQILSLTSKCRTLLMESIDLSNCCVLLLFADMHQDMELKRAVIHYFTENKREVLHCDQWRDLEKNRPQIAIETFREVFLFETFPDEFYAFE